MISIVIITHYSLGDSYKQVINHIFDIFDHDLDDDYIIGCDREETPEESLLKIKKVLKKIPSNQEVLILSDIYGATPCNVLNKLHSQRKIRVVTGLNIPILIKAIQGSTEYDNVDELADKVVDAGKKGVFTYDLKQKNND